MWSPLCEKKLVGAEPKALARHLQGDVALALGIGGVKVTNLSALASPAIRRGLLAAAQKRQLPVSREALKGIGTTWPGLGLRFVARNGEAKS